MGGRGLVTTQAQVRHDGRSWVKVERLRCSYCLYHPAETKSPLRLCRMCYDYLGAYWRRKLDMSRRGEY